MNVMVLGFERVWQLKLAWQGRKRGWEGKKRIWLVIRWNG